MLIYKFLGSGGVCPQSNRGLTALYVQCNKTSILIDCGESVQVFATKYGISLFGIDALFITHLHADHILGIPGLLATMSNCERRKPLIVYGPPGTMDKIHAMQKLLYSISFRVFVVEIEPEDSVEFTNFTVTAAALQHSVVCYGYSVVVNRPPEYSADVVKKGSLSDAAVSLLQSGCNIEYNGIKLDINAVFGANREFMKLVYATDTGVCNSLIELCADADVAILDGSYGTEDQRPALNTSEIHMSFAEAATVAKKSGVKKLVLTHFSPSLVAPWIHIANATDIFKNAVCAYGGYFGSIIYGGEEEANIPSVDITNRAARGIIHRGYGYVKVCRPFKLEGSRCKLESPRFSVIASVSDVMYARNGSACKYADAPDVCTLMYVEMLQCTKYLDAEVTA